LAVAKNQSRQKNLTVTFWHFGGSDLVVAILAITIFDLAVMPVIKCYKLYFQNYTLFTELHNSPLWFHTLSDANWQFWSKKIRLNGQISPEV